MTLEQRPAYERYLLAACIILAPLSISLYALTWTGDLRAPISMAANASPLANTLHFVGAVAASFFLPLGYLAMSMLGMRRAPRLGFWAAALSLVSWIPWPALIGLDDLAYQVTLAGDTPAQAALWAQTNGDPVMTLFLLVYIIGHLISAIVIAIMLRRLRIIPAWAAWAFALSSPLTILYFVIHAPVAKLVFQYLVCVVWIAGVIPATIAMSKGKD